MLPVGDVQGRTERFISTHVPRRSRLHVDEDFAAVEFIRDPRSGSCRVIGSSLSNPATALLRYDAGDLAMLAAEGYPCGRPGRVIERIDGRREDYLVLPNGARVGRMDHVFKDMIKVREAQIHQRRPGDLTLRFVRGVSYSESDETRLLRAMRTRIGTDTRIEIDYVDAVPRSRTGKLRLVISEAPEAAVDLHP